MRLNHNTIKAAAIAIAAMAAVTTPAYAALSGDGYYRVQNNKSGRYIYVLDDKGELNFQATTADLGALELWYGQERTISDPATIIYIKDQDGRGRDFDFMSQGTGVMQLINHAVSVLVVPGTTDRYRIFGRDSGVSRYIGDGAEYEGDKGRVGSTQPANSEWVIWQIHPVDNATDNYFGITPDVTGAGGNYASFYASFPFTPVSGGTTAYTVSRVVDDVAVITPVEGTVAPGTPVIIKTASADPAQNKITLGGEAAAPAVNMLKGVYFKNESLSHTNLTPYNPATMRLLGTGADGKAAFVTTADTYLPRNKAYIELPEGAPAQLRIMTEDEYNAGTDMIAADHDVSLRLEGLTLCVDGMAEGMAVSVCDITGRTIYSGTDSRILLPAPGIYIARAAGRAYKFVARR